MARLGHEMLPCNAVFIDTSLDTHFATVFSFSDTVSDLKQKIICEHSLCFPHVGDIKILALKVKRKGCLYHLSDSMLLGSIFPGVNKNWFLKVDAVIEKDNNDCSGMIANGVNLLLNGPPQMLSGDVADNRKASGSDEQLNLDVAGEGVPKNGCNEGNEVERTRVGGEEINSRSEVGDMQTTTQPETVLDTGSHTKKKHKSRKKSKHNGELASNEDCSVPEAAKNEARQEIVSSIVPQGDAMVNENGATINEAQETAAASGVPRKNAELKSDDSRRGVIDVHSNKSVEDTSKSERRAKKKRKFNEIREDDEHVPKRDESLTGDSSKGMIEPPSISQKSPVDETNYMNPTLVSSVTETLDDVHLQSAGSRGGKKKKKKKSKNTADVEVATSPSRTDIRGQNSGLGVNSKHMEQELATRLAPGKNVNDGASSEPGAVSLKGKHGDSIQVVNVTPTYQEIDMGNSDADNMKGRHDSSHLGVPESDNTEKETEVSRDKNIVLGDHQNLGVGKTNKAEREQKVVLDSSSKTLPSEKYEPPALDVLASKTKEVGVSSKLLEASETRDHLKSSKRVKKSRKAKELESEIPCRPVTENIEGFGSAASTKPRTRANRDHTCNNVNDDGINVAPKAGKEVSEIKTNSSLLITDKDIDDVIRNAVQSVQQIGQGGDGAENMGGKSRKKSKKERTLDAEMENENHKVSADTSIREVEHSSNGPPIHNQSSHGHPHKTKGNSERRFPEAIVDGNTCKSGHANEGSGNFEVSCRNSGINFNGYLMRNQHDDKVVDSGELHVDKAIKPMKVDGVKKANKKRNLSAHSHGPSPNLESSHSLTEKHGIGAELPKVSDSEVKVPPPRNSEELNSGREKPRKSNAVNTSATSTYGKSKTTASNSSLESSKGASFLKTRANGDQLLEDHHSKNGRKTSAGYAGEIVNGSQHKESMVGVLDSIFKDVADEASSNEEDNSDSSTRTPSDKSLSSDYSDGESNADLRSSQNGSDSWRRKDGSEKAIRKPLSSSGMTLDSVLRSSTSYKKAKLTASLSQLEDTESQPIEFVPDSQANS